MSTDPALLNELYALIRPYTDEAQALDENTALVADLELDSVKVMKLLLDIEDHYDVSVPLNVLPEIQTIGQLAAQIQQLTRGDK